MKGSSTGWNNNDPGFYHNTWLGAGKSGESDPDRHTYRRVGYPTPGSLHCLPAGRAATPASYCCGAEPLGAGHSICQQLFDAGESRPNCVLCELANPHAP